MTRHSTWFPGARPPPGIDPTAPNQPILGADTETADYRDTEPRHVEVATEQGWVPGLLLGWRKPRGQLWQGRVTFADLRAGEWVTVTEWLRSSLIRPVDSDEGGRLVKVRERHHGIV